MQHVQVPTYKNTQINALALLYSLFETLKEAPKGKVEDWQLIVTTQYYWIPWMITWNW